MNYHGQTALQTAVLVAFTQLIPEHQVQFFGAFSVRVKVITLYPLYLVISPPLPFHTPYTTPPTLPQEACPSLPFLMHASPCTRLRSHLALFASSIDTQFFLLFWVGPMTAPANVLCTSVISAGSLNLLADLLVPSSHRSLFPGRHLKRTLCPGLPIPLDPHPIRLACLLGLPPLLQAYH